MWLWSVNPLWMYVAVAGFVATVLIHTIASRLAPKVEFSWVGMLKGGRISGVLSVRIRDLLVILIRSLLVGLLFAYLAKPFIYRGRPPAEIWVKGVPLSVVKDIRRKWGDFAEIRFSYNPNPKGRVALVGQWEGLPSGEYEFWTLSSDWEVLDISVSDESFEVEIANSGEDRWFGVEVRSGGKTVLKDSFFIRGGETSRYTATLNLKGEITVSVENRTFYDYVLRERGETEVFAKGLEREIWDALAKTLGVDLTVGVDTLLKEEGSLSFVRDCEKLEGEGLEVERDVVEFVFEDSGCVFLSGTPVLLDGKGKPVGVKHTGGFVFGFSPVRTGWAFTPDFLKFIASFSKKRVKVYASVGDTVKFPEPTEISGKTKLCCPTEFVPKVPGVYALKRGGEDVGVLVVNPRYDVKIPEPPKPLWNYVLPIFLLLLTLEGLLLFKKW